MAGKHRAPAFRLPRMPSIRRHAAPATDEKRGYHHVESDQPRPPRRPAAQRRAYEGRHREGRTPVAMPDPYRASTRTQLAGRRASRPQYGQTLAVRDPRDDVTIGRPPRHATRPQGDHVPSEYLSPSQTQRRLREHYNPRNEQDRPTAAANVGRRGNPRDRFEAGRGNPHPRSGDLARQNVKAKGRARRPASPIRNPRATTTTPEPVPADRRYPRQTGRQFHTSGPRRSDQPGR